MSNLRLGALPPKPSTARRPGRVHWAGRPCGVAPSARLTDEAGQITCRLCRRAHSPYGSIEARWARSETRQRARDRREAEAVILARHADELSDELALRAVARIGGSR